MNDPVWDFYDRPYEPPPSMEYQIGPREFASVTAIGNWYAMQADRDRWQKVAENLATQLGNWQYAHNVYRELGEQK